MTHGRKVCNTLKEIRQQIADKNEIEYVTSECHFEGECKGTCLKCESEVKYLEKELHKRKLIGKAVAVAGISLGVAGIFPACNTSKQNTFQNDNLLNSEETRIRKGQVNDTIIQKGEVNATVKGKVLNADGKTPLEWATARLMQGDVMIRGAYTDAKGEFSLTSIPAGKYNLIITCIGFLDYVEDIKIRDSSTKIIDNVKMTTNENMQMEIIIMGRSTNDFDPFDFGKQKLIRKNGEFFWEW